MTTEMLRSGDRLKEYRAKRDFSRTPEPAPSRARKSRGKLSYLIQKHDASHTHYDFRLEHDGVLLSWAVPRGPSYDTADKRLAVRTEDHPLEYGKFEGTIPEDEYGGGTVMLWDTGTWEPQEGIDIDEGLKNGKLAFLLYGKRLQGKWALVRMRAGKKDRGKENWLLIKEIDDLAGPEKRPIVEREKRSVTTGRTMEEIAKGRKVWHSNKPARGARSREIPARPSGGKGVGKKRRKARPGDGAPLPRFVSPQLATLVEGPPPGNDWLHEIKYDGYRAIAAVAGDRAKIYTRNGLDWTDRFHPLVPALQNLPCSSALLDGEIAIADSRGHTNFGALQQALSESTGGFSYYLFDILELDGKDLKKRPLVERKEILRKLLGKVRPPLVYSDHIEGAGEQAYRHACELKLEGIISKLADAPYRPGRAKSWLKSKCGMEQEFVIIGWTPSDKPKRPFRSLLVAVNDEGALRYAGRVGSGFDETLLDELGAQLKRYERKKSPAEGVPPEIARRARFVEPKLVGEIEFRGWTTDGVVRQAAFKGLRADKPAREIVQERPMAKGKAKRKSTVATAPKAGTKKARSSSIVEDDGVDTLSGVRITHPERVLYPDDGVTKRDLADYYLKIAKRILPHIKGRPLSLVRTPDGIGGERFFQKHASKGWPDAFKSVRIREKSGSDEYIYIDDEAGLVAAVQMSAVELHIWGACVDDVERPDRLVFDLDPDEGLSFADVKKAAQDVKKRLERLGLKSFPMATGGKGIHIVIPLKGGHSWDDHRNFAEAVARVMADEEPNRFVANMSKAKRHGKIFIDYLRNQRGATAIAPFSSRAREGAPVAWPISWQQLARLKNAQPAHVDDFKLPSVDPWKGYFKLKQKLPRL